MKRLPIILLTLLAACATAAGQSKIIKDFKPVCDSLHVLIEERTTVKGNLALKAVMKRGSVLDFYFTESLGDYPWHKGDTEWFRRNLRSLFPDEYGKYRLGQVYSNRISLERYVTPELGYNGSPSDTKYRRKAADNPSAIVERIGAMDFDKGLDGRHITLWQSHGRYYEQKTGRWEWQRPCLFQTCEDMFTQAYVLPYLAPMLENAGAYIMMPRERDTQKFEIIADNDSTAGGRGKAAYKEKGIWKDAGQGFADLKPVYSSAENPFVAGTARQAEVIPSSKKGGTTSITWTPEIPQRGEYAVYISYKSLPNSTRAAYYTVYHLGGTSRFAVNQKMGGGTWIYLGTFEFEAGSKGYVRLENRTPEGYRYMSGTVVTADAVRFGGGMGNIERGGSVSGMPRSAEGARYWLQWAGADSTVYSQNEGGNDYRDDFMCRGDWVEWISRGSEMNPDKKGGLGIPVDLSFAWHSDAGVRPDSSIVGTLAIYTLKSEGRQTLPDGEDRMTAREYTDLVQSQIVNDIRATFDTTWTRRQTWNRAYRESRTPSAPAMLLEFLSHQNFADMKYGLDPSFRFAVSRSVYKGMLKYISNRYGRSYAVQPLPVGSVGVRFAEEGKAKISWLPVTDPLEPTAVPSGYILYTRVNDGGFDEGLVLKDVKRDGERLSTGVRIVPGNIYSFRIAAYNDGGVSFCSETVSIGVPDSCDMEKKVLIVNNFDRVSGPAFFDTPQYAGFDNRLDSGVPYLNDIAFIGEMYENRRVRTWTDDENPGFGASYGDYAGEVTAGNSFDYPYIHGKSVMKAGYAFCSCSNEAFCEEPAFRKDAWSVDLICGKQVTTVTGTGMQQRYTVFPQELQKTIKDYTEQGGNILVSGSNIGTDIWSEVYPVRVDSTFREDSKRFARNVLGYKWSTNHASRRGQVKPLDNPMLTFVSEGYSFYNTPNSRCYCVETPDGIVPASSQAASIMRYSDTGISAGVCFEGRGYRSVCLGFPIEVLHEEDQMDNIISTTLQFFSK